MVISTAIDVVRDEPERRQRLWDNQRYFRQAHGGVELQAGGHSLAEATRRSCPQYPQYRP